MLVFLLACDFTRERERHSKKVAELSSLLRESRNLNATLENVVLRLQVEVDEERKRTETVKTDAIAAIERCNRAVKRLEDLRGATEVEKMIGTKSSMASMLKLKPPRKAR